MTVRVSLLDGEVVRDRIERTVFVRHEPERDFRFMAWGYPQTNYVSSMEREALRHYGFEIFYPYHWIGAPAHTVERVARNLSRSGMLITPYAQRDSSAGKDGIRRPCMTTQEFRDKRRQDLGGTVKGGAPFGIVQRQSRRA